MIVTARAVGLGGLAACDRRLVMGDALAITVRSERGVVIAAVTGEIDMAPLQERLFELADSGGTLIVDLNRVTFTDSLGRSGRAARGTGRC